LTLRIRSVKGHDLSLEHPELERLTGEVALRGVEEPVHVPVRPPDAGEREPRTLPHLMMVDLGNGGAEATLELRFHREELLPLALQGVALGKVELRAEDSHVPAAHDPASG